MRPTPPKTMSDGSGRLVDASTLFNTQILQRDMQTDGTATDVGEGR